MMTTRFSSVARCLATMALASACGGAIDTTAAQAAADESTPAPALPVRGPDVDESREPTPPAPQNVDPIDPFTTDVAPRGAADAGADTSSGTVPGPT